jgi:hypothetical protein
MTKICRCPKPIYCDVVWVERDQVLAQSRFHAEAIREALDMIEGNGMYKAGRAQIDAVLKCMEGEKE